MHNELIRSKEELENIADMMSEEIKNPNENIVSRYLKVVYNSASFFHGKQTSDVYPRTHINTEYMQRGIYFKEEISELLPHNFDKIMVSKEQNEINFKFDAKNIDLPTEEAAFIESIPSGINMYDAEFLKFTKEHKDTAITRNLSIEQNVVVNSKGGKKIQSIPFFSVYFSNGYEPVHMQRHFAVGCNSEKDIKNLTSLIKYLADPTLDKKIKNAKTFTEAFDELCKISPLKYRSLEEAGVARSSVHDVVMLNGFPVHEIFGHHFEEPIVLLDPKDIATFRQGHSEFNKDLVLIDNPKQKVEGYKVVGFTNFDAYGRKRKAVTHVEDGKINDFLGSEYVDSKKLKQFMNVEKSNSIGNASQFIDGVLPQARMSCTVLDGPSEDVDLEGKILMVPNGGHTNGGDKIYNVTSAECYVIKNGKPIRVAPHKVTGGIYQALVNLSLLDDISYSVGMCKKGPAIVPVSQVSKTQIWKNQQVIPLPISDKHLRILTE